MQQQYSIKCDLFNFYINVESSEHYSISLAPTTNLINPIVTTKELKDLAYFILNTIGEKK